MKKILASLILLALAAFVPATVSAWFPRGILTSSSVIPTLTPGPAWTGAVCSYGYGATCAPAAVDATLHGTSGFQLQPTAAFDEPPKMWIERGCAGKCIGANYVIAVAAGNADRAQIAEVIFYLEGNSATTTTPALNPRDGVFGYAVNVQSTATLDGDAVLIADVVPVNGYVKRLFLPLTLNTNGSISHPVFYLDNMGSDTLCDGTVRAAPSGPATKQHCAWASVNHAQGLGGATSGSIVQVTSGQTFLDDATIAQSNYAATRMIQFLPSVAGVPYTISKTSRYENSSIFSLMAQNALFDSAIFDMSKIALFQNGLTSAITVFRNVRFLDPYGAGGPTLTSANCTAKAAFPCLYGSPESTAGNMNALFFTATGTFVAVIDSPAVSQTVELTQGNLYRNWTAQNSLDTFAEFSSPSNGSYHFRSYLNDTFTNVVPFFNRDTYDFPQNLTVAAIHYCTNAPMMPSNYLPTNNPGTLPYIAGTPHAATIVQLAIAPTTFTGSIASSTLTVTGTPSSPLFPGLYFSGSDGAGDTVSGAYLVKQVTPTTWQVSGASNMAAGATFTSTGTNAAGGEKFGGGFFVGNNQQYVVFGSGSSLVNGGVMFAGDAGNAGATAVVGNPTDPTCGGQTLIAPHQPFIVIECNGSFYGICDPNYQNMQTLVFGPSGAPVFEGLGPGVSQTNPRFSNAAAVPAVPAIGDSVLLFNIGHADFGQITSQNSTTENYSNLLMQNSTLASVESNPFLYGAGTITTPTMTASQSGTAFAADPLTIASVSGSTATLASAPTLPTLSTSGGTSSIGGAVSQPGLVTTTASCATSPGGCVFVGPTGTYQAPDFTSNLVAGSRIAVQGENGVWQVDQVLDATHLVAHSMGGLTSAGVVKGAYYKIGAALHFTTGALAGQEFPVAAEHNSGSVQTVSVEPFGTTGLSAAAAGDQAFITPSLVYGDFIMWTNCIGNASNNYAYSAALAFPTPYAATMTQSETCGAGSKYVVAQSVVGSLYMNTILATNILNQAGFQEEGQFGQGILGWAFVQSTLYGSVADFRNSITTNRAFGIDQSAALDSLFYQTTFDINSSTAVLSDYSPFPSLIQLNFNNDAFFNQPGAVATSTRPLSVGTPAQAAFYASGQMNSNFVIPAGGALTLPLAGLLGNPARPDGAPIMPYSQQGVALGAGALVGAVR